jgi:hypothetical protein
MADIEWPAELMPYKTLFYLQPHVGGQESPITRTRKVYGLSAPRWLCRITLRAGHGWDRDIIGSVGPKVSDALFWSARIDALIAELQGGLNCVLLHDFRRPAPQSYLSTYGQPTTTTGANKGATSMILQRTPGAYGPSIGDYIGGDGRPHIVTKISPGAGSMMSKAPANGQIAVEFQPPLSATMALGATVLQREVTAPFRLVSDDAGQNETDVGAPVEYVLDFAEDVR